MLRVPPPAARDVVGTRSNTAQRLRGRKRSRADQPPAEIHSWNENSFAASHDSRMGDLLFTHVALYDRRHGAEKTRKARRPVPSERAPTLPTGVPLCSGATAALRDHLNAALCSDLVDAQTDVGTISSVSILDSIGRALSTTTDTILQQSNLIMHAFSLSIGPEILLGRYRYEIVETAPSIHLFRGFSCCNCCRLGHAGWRRGWRRALHPRAGCSAACRRPG